MVTGSPGIQIETLFFGKTAGNRGHERPGCQIVLFFSGGRIQFVLEILFPEFGLFFRHGGPAGEDADQNGLVGLADPSLLVKPLFPPESELLFIGNIRFPA